MNSTNQTANTPDKPLVLYDGDCAFCCRLVARWQHVTGDAVDYLPLQDQTIPGRFPELQREALESSVHLVEKDGSVFSGARAVLGALAHSSNPRQQALLLIYERSPAFASIAESVYGFTARNRRIFSAFTRIFSSKRVEPSSYERVRSWFLRSLALIYLIAFVSFWVQIDGLISSHGILPLKDGLQTLRQATTSFNSLQRYHMFPTLSWIDSSDTFLEVQCGLGTILCFFVLAGLAPAPCLFLLWLIYLSLATAGREFYAFQWDNLLLEAGFLAIFLAPLQFLTWRRRSPAPSVLIIWLFRWLLFRLMFESGWVKLLSGDPAWRRLTALTVHYQTQPLPTPLAWYIHQLPGWFQMSCTLAMFIIELIVPLLIFGPPRFRRIACGLLVALQVVIFLTGNYCFFNLLTIALCIFLLDDSGLRNLLPAKWRFPGWVSRTGLMRWVEPPTQTNIPGQKLWRWPLPFLLPLTLLIVLLSGFQLLGMFRPNIWPRFVLASYNWVSNFRSINGYGLFAMMTTTRPEIVIQGSNDGRAWFDYEFKYKPGDVKRRPTFVAPYQPRLDWQMWFAALGNYRQNPWFINLCVRLLENSPEALDMLKKNPFPWKPPRYVRALVYEYRFTDSRNRRQTGAWWQRDLKGVYFPVLALRE